jgi:hypothetical protein
MLFCCWYISVFANNTLTGHKHVYAAVNVSREEPTAQDDFFLEPALLAFATAADGTPLYYAADYRMPWAHCFHSSVKKSLDSRPPLTHTHAHT